MSLPAVMEPSSREEVTRARATEISQSSLLPEYFADNPANVQYVMEIGNSLGINPVAALSHVHVFPDGKGKLKCSLSADLMVALARNAGHIVHVQGHASKATATLIRGDATPEKMEALERMGLNPKDFFVFTSVWTTEKVMTAGMSNKDNHKKYPAEMLKSRAKSSVVRDGASEVLLGIADRLKAMGIELTDDVDENLAVNSGRYTAEELGAETDQDGVPVNEVTVTRTDAGTKVTVKDQLRDFVKTHGSLKVAEWAKVTFESIDKKATEKRVQLSQVRTVCAELGCDKDQLTIEGTSTTLGALLTKYINATNSEN